MKRKLKHTLWFLFAALFISSAIAQDDDENGAPDDFANPEALLRQLPPPPPAPSPLPTATESDEDGANEEDVDNPKPIGSTPPLPNPTTPTFSETVDRARNSRPTSQQNRKFSVPGEQPTSEPKEKASKDASISTADGLVSLDFVNTEIGEIAKSISELTKRNFILDDKVRGKVTIISPAPVTVSEAYQAFVSALEVKNFTIVPAGKMLKIVSLREMKNSPIPTDIARPAGGDDIFVTRLIPLKFISTAEVSKTLRGLVSKNGDMISYDPTNTLILTDSVGNIRRLLKIIRKLDQKGFQETLVVIPLKYASASETVENINRIYDLKADANKAPKSGATAAGGDDLEISRFVSKLIPDDRTNSIIVLANKQGVKRVREVIEKLDRTLEEEVEGGRIHVHYLQYSDAVELAATLGSLAGGSSGPTRRNRTSPSSTNPSAFTRAGGNNDNVRSTAPSPTSVSGIELFNGDVQITADTATNALVIVSSPSDYKSILPVIRKLDRRRPQAFIESMILEVNIDKAYELGVSSHLGKQFGGADPTTVFGSTSFGSNSSLFLPVGSSGGLDGLTLGLQGKTIDIPIAGGESLTIPIYGGLFRALQSNGTINVLSTPNILTSDNIEAEIVVGQVVPFLTAQGRDINNQPINQIQRENVALTLRVTPQINESDDITMDIYLENQDLVPGINQETFGPTTSKRSTKTTVIVKDSQTVTVGGLISERESDSVGKVPVLGDIPIIGWFFKNKSRRKQKTSLAIFLTPHIIHAPEDLAEMSIQNNRRRKKFLDQHKMKEHGGIERYDLDKDLNVPTSKRVPQNETEDIVPQDSPSGAFLTLPPEKPSPAVVKETIAEDPEVNRSGNHDLAPVMEETPQEAEPVLDEPGVDEPNVSEPVAPTNPEEDEK